MLAYLCIRNFIFIDELAVYFQPGMNVLTGETGAGKSILYQALWTALGGTIRKSIIPVEQASCYIEAQFNLQSLEQVKQWLVQHKYIEKDQVDNENSCRIVRTISRQGRVQAFVNGRSISLKSLKLLRAQLIRLYGQHDQQRLLTEQYPRECLDAYGDYPEIIGAVKYYYLQHKQFMERKVQLQKNIQEREDNLNLITYQLQELEEAQLEPNEWVALEQEQQQLFSAAHTLEQGHTILLKLTEREPMSIRLELKGIQASLQKLFSIDKRFDASCQSIQEALIHLTEADSALRDVLNQVIIDPERLQQVEERLTKLHALGRKHGVRIDQLFELSNRLQREQEQLKEYQIALQACEEERVEILRKYQSVATQLTKQRARKAAQLEVSITEKIAVLGMQSAQFKIQLNPINGEMPFPWGNEKVIFLLSAAAGQPLQPLSQGASGGELSRLNLIIQSIIGETTAVPTLIFDEVDIGVGGGIGEMMGRLLREISLNHQVLCITHLPQVAAQGHHHYHIEKRIENGKSHTDVKLLENEAQRVQEIARMLGGVYITLETIEHAKVMLGVGLNKVADN
jgi:DNA repair protein RecN (Recombination protein N)